MSGSQPPYLAVSSNGIAVVPDAQLNTFVSGSSVVANLRAFVPLEWMQVWLIGTTTPNDGGQGMFYYDISATTADDDGVTCIQPNGITFGRWLRQSGSGTSIEAVINIAALRALSTGNSPVWVEGYYVPGDGGEGMFNIGVAAGDNGGTIITSGNGTYYRETFGQPFSVRWFGAKGDGSTDDTGAIQAAISSTGSPGVFVPSGNYKTTSTLTITKSNTSFVGVGYDSTIKCAASVDTIQIGGASTQVSGVRISSINFAPTIAKTNGAEIHILTAFVTFIDDIIIGGATPFVGISIDNLANASTYHVRDFYISLCSQSGIQIGAVAGSIQTVDTYLSDGTIANCGAGLTIGSASGVYCSDIDITGCVSGGLSLAPSTNQISDFCFFTNFLLDSISNGFAVSLTPSVANGGAAILNIYFANCYAAGATGSSGHGVFIDPNGTNTIGAIQWNGGVVRDNARFGFYLLGGINITITGCQVFNNSISSVGTYNGIEVGAGVEFLIISNNQIGAGGIDASDGETQGFGINLETGSSFTRYYTITGNILAGNLTAPLANGQNTSSSYPFYIANNPGLIVQSLVNITVGSSPFTYTADAQAETVFISGGTVSSITLDTVVIFATTNVSVPLQPYEVLTVTFSGTPTMNVRRA